MALHKGYNSCENIFPHVASPLGNPNRICPFPPLAKKFNYTRWKSKNLFCPPAPLCILNNYPPLSPLYQRRSSGICTPRLRHSKKQCGEFFTAINVFPGALARNFAWNQDEVGSKNPQTEGWKVGGRESVADKSEEWKGIYEGPGARLLKSPFMVLESTFVRQSTFVFAATFYTSFHHPFVFSSFLIQHKNSFLESHEFIFVNNCFLIR